MCIRDSPGIPQGSLYPTLSALSSGPVAIESEDQEDQTQNNDIEQVKQQLFNTKGSSDNIPESHITVTGYPLQHQEVVTSIIQANIDLDVNLPDD